MYGPAPWSDNQTSFHEWLRLLCKNFPLTIHAGFSQEVVKWERPEHQSYKYNHIKERAFVLLNPSSPFNFPFSLCTLHLSHEQKTSFLGALPQTQQAFPVLLYINAQAHKQQRAIRQKDWHRNGSQTSNMFQHRPSLFGMEVSVQRQANTPTCEQRSLTRQTWSLSTRPCLWTLIKGTRKR